MFILRKITGKNLNGNIEMNFNLGNSYTVITEERNPEQFKEAVNKGAILCDPIIYGFVTDEGGEVHQLSVQQQSYIMTETGKTFDNLTIK